VKNPYQGRSARDGCRSATRADLHIAALLGGRARARQARGASQPNRTRLDKRLRSIVRLVAPHVQDARMPVSRALKWERCEARQERGRQARRPVARLAQRLQVLSGRHGGNRLGYFSAGLFFFPPLFASLSWQRGGTRAGETPALHNHSPQHTPGVAVAAPGWGRPG
jgi:hypothetical protein